MKNKLTALLGVLGLSVFLVTAGETEVYAADQVKVNIDLDGGTLNSNYDLQLNHEEISGEEENGGSWIEIADYFTVKQMRELGEPEKEGYTFIGWHGSSEVYTNTESVDYTPIEIRYIDYYEGWGDEDTIYSPRLVDENNNEIDEITLTAVYVPNLIVDAGDGAFADGSKTIEIEADPSQSDTSRYVYLIPEESSPIYNDIAGVIELESNNTERDGNQSIAGDYIDVLPGETVEVVYEPSVMDDTTTLVVEEPDIEFADIDTDEEIEATAFGRFIEAMKEVFIKCLPFIMFIVGLFLAEIVKLFTYRMLARVEIKNNNSLSEYEENNFVTVQKDVLNEYDRVWQVTIKDETLNNRESNEFILVLNKSFVKRFNGQQLVVKIGESDNAKTQGFTIDEQETEIKLTVDLNE